MKARIRRAAGLGCGLAGLLLASTATGRAPPPTLHAYAPLAVSDSSRIVYPRGHYPQLRQSDGKMREVHSVLAITRRLQFGDYVWDDAGVPPGPIWVRVDLARQLLSVFRGGDEIGTAVIIYGTASHPTPTGVFSVLARTAYYHSKSYDAPMPYTLRITADGVALHASLVRERWATHGCIGTPYEFARQLFNAMRLGDRVDILPA